MCENLILISEDSTEFKDFIFKQKLNDLGYENVKMVHNGAVIKECETTTPKLVLIGLFASNNWKVTRKIKKLHPNMPIIAVSNTLKVEESFKSYQYGVTTFFHASETNLSSMIIDSIQDKIS